jgi:hypothetical protein
LKRKAIILAAILVALAALIGLARLADQSNYGKADPSARSTWTVTAELPKTNSSAATK